MSDLTRLHYFVDSIIENGQFSSMRLGLALPDLIQGNCKEILQDDFNYLISKWFLDSLRPLNSAKGSSYPCLYKSIYRTLSKRFPESPNLEIQEAAKVLARLAIKTEPNTLSRRQTNFPKAIRNDLLAKSGKRCAICGFRFTLEIIDSFLEGSVPQNRYFSFDFLKHTRKHSAKDPHWHSRINIDHINPIAKGGTNSLNNLQLLCGFCNSSKSNHMSIFDNALGDKKPAKEIMHNRLGLINISNWFLVVRVLNNGRCYSCGMSAQERELTVAALGFSKEINPSNIFVTCYHCDPIKEHRHIPNKL